MARFPHTSKKELGKILYRENPDLIKDEEDGRKEIRRVTGAAGDPRVSRVKQTDKYQGLPKGRKNDYSKYVLEPGKYGILSDIHIPSHDDEAVGIALEYFYKHGITNLVLNGDILDCYQVSDHVKDPTEPQIKAEFDCLRPWLRFLQQKGFTIVYKLGNHEERLERFLQQKAPALFGWEILSWDALIATPGVTVVDNKRIIQAGKLSIIHGHEFGRQAVFNPVNPARGYFIRAKASVLGGDKHQSSEHIESDINGRVMGAWSTGCLCDLHPKYLPINRWNLGFAVVEHDGDEFEVQNLKILAGRVR